MNKLSCTIFSFVLCLLGTIAKAQVVNEGKCLISGSVNGVESGFVRLLSDDASKVIDSAAIINGKFLMRINMDSSVTKPFMIMPGHWSFRGIMEDTRIKFEIDTADAIHQYFNKRDFPIIWQIKETGSALADLYKKYQDETGQTYFISLLLKLKSAKDKSSIDAIKTSADSIRKHMQVNQKEWIEKYVHQYPQAVAGVFIFDEFYHSAFPALQAGYLASVLAQFTGPAKGSIYYRRLLAEAGNLKNIQQDNTAPDFTLLKQDGTVFRLSEFQGSITIVDFWASWCVPCRVNIPDIKKLYNAYHHKGLNIVSVSIDDSKKNWRAALNKEMMPWAQVIDERNPESNKRKVNSLFPSKSIPFYVLINKEGKVMITSGDEKVIEKQVKEIFK